MSAQIRAPDVEVWLGGARDPRSHCLSVEASIGGGRGDAAVIEQHLMPREPGLGAGLIATQFAQQPCEIVRIGGAGAREVLHRGFVSAAGVQLVDTSTIRFTSRLDSYHFGEPVAGQVAWNPLQNIHSDTGERIVFNPEVDGRVLPNCSNRLHSFLNCPLFLHPESQRQCGALLVPGSGHLLLAADQPRASQF
jgi:hypothetical protein